MFYPQARTQALESDHLGLISSSVTCQLNRPLKILQDQVSSLVNVDINSTSFIELRWHPSGLIHGKPLDPGLAHSKHKILGHHHDYCSYMCQLVLKECPNCNSHRHCCMKTFISTHLCQCCVLSFLLTISLFANLISKLVALILLLWLLLINIFFWWLGIYLFTRSFLFMIFFLFCINHLSFSLRVSLI